MVFDKRSDQAVVSTHDRLRNDVRIRSVGKALHDIANKLKVGVVRHIEFVHVVMVGFESKSPWSGVASIALLNCCRTSRNDEAIIIRALQLIEASDQDALALRFGTELMQQVGECLGNSWGATGDSR